MQRRSIPTFIRAFCVAACSLALVANGTFAFTGGLGNRGLSTLAIVTKAPVGSKRSVKFGLNGVPEVLLEKFTSGAAITKWFCFVPDPNDTHYFQTYFTEADFATLKRLQIRFVRLAVSPEVFYDNGVVNAGNWPSIAQALKRIQEHGLGVILDLHDGGQMKLDTPGKDNSGFVSFWRQVAKLLKGQDEDGMVFETLNEPQFLNNGSVWYALLNETVAAIRSEDPKRTILATGDGWDGISDLDNRPLLPFTNVIYSSHSYDPFFFTHQGAFWTNSPPKDLQSVPFPSSPEAVAKILPLNPPSEKDNLIWYGNQHFDENYLLGRMQTMATWGQEHHVPMLLGEFGSYPVVAPKESRAAWFRAIRKALIATDLPHSLWAYDDVFGLARTLKDGKVMLDPVTVKNFFGR